MDKEFLNWTGNFINFLILIYLIRISFNIGYFDFQQSLIATFGLSISIIIQLYNLISK